MKNLALVAIAASLFFVSCNNDDDTTEVDNNQASLVGTWKLTTINMAIAVDINQDGVAGTNFIEETGCYNNSALVFAANNTATLTLDEPEVEVVEGANGEMETVITCNTMPSIPGTYIDNGNQVIMVVDGEEGTFIRSGNTLTLTEDGDGSQLGGTLVFTKQ